MLRLMRQHASSWLIKIILGAIIFVFVLYFGSGSMRQRKATRIAFVNEEPIMYEAYRDAYNRLVERYRQFGTELNDEMIKRLQKQAVDGLIDQTLLSQEAEKLNLRVSDTELAESISKMDVFQTDGAFNNRLYTNLLRNNRMTPEMFEQLQREAILTGKVRSLILSSAKVSDNEVTEWFKWNNASMKIAYVLFEFGKYNDIEPTDEEVKAYFEENKDAYKTQPTVKAQYVHFRPNTYTSQVEAISDEGIQDYYEGNPDEFKVEKTVSARHILLKVDKDADDALVEEKKKKALEIMEKAKAGEDFAELAKTYSEDSSKNKGGDLGEFTRNRMVKPFSDKAFSMKPGEISEPVKTRFGWHIIKVEKVNEEKILTLEESKEKIRKKLTQKRSKEIAYDEAEKLFYDISDGDDLAKVAEERGFEIKITDFFPRSGPKKGVRNRSKFAKAAFDLSPMEISEPKDCGDGYYIIQPLEKKPEETEDFENVKAKVRRELVRKKQEEKAEKDAGELLAALKQGADMTEECKSRELESKTTDFFKRTDYSIPDLGYEQEIPKAAFKLSPDKKFPETVIKGRKGYYVIAFEEKKEPASEEIEKEKENTRERLLQQKQFKIFQAWLSQVKENSEIIIDEEFRN